jgi:hypothetical protein
VRVIVSNEGKDTPKIFFSSSTGDMNKFLVLLAVLLGLSSARTSLADVIITEPVGGNDVPADRCGNSTNGAAFTALGDIVISEGLGSDFHSGNGLTFRLTLPDGWQFNPTGATVSVLNSRDISSASIAVTVSNLTVTFSVSGTTKLDQLTIHGLQVQALDGTSDPNAGYILNLSSDPGTAVINGVAPDLGTFGLLNTIPGTPKALGLTTQPSPNATAGVNFTPQPVVMTFDQLGNQCYLDETTFVNASRAAGTGTLLGSTTVEVISGGCSFTNLNHTIANTITILFTATNLSSVTSGPIVVSPAPASRLIFITQPGAALSGAPFGTQPSVKSHAPCGPH